MKNYNRNNLIITFTIAGILILSLLSGCDYSKNTGWRQITSDHEIITISGRHFYPESRDGNPVRGVIQLRATNTRNFPICYSVALKLVDYAILEGTNVHLLFPRSHRLQATLIQKTWNYKGENIVIDGAGLQGLEIIYYNYIEGSCMVTIDE